MANVKLGVAKKRKMDEFYTQLKDIESELKHYKEQFKNKIVFLNADDPYESNFFKYFAINFNYLKLKKIIATSYAGSPIAFTQLSIFDNEIKNSSLIESKKAYKIVINEVVDINNDGAIDLADVEYLIKNKKNILTKLNSNGDFRSKEILELLKEADIVVTNPPFSLFREHINQLFEHKKKFLVIGNKNAITYKEIFQLIKKNEFYTGYRPMSGGMWFCVPEGNDYDKLVDGVKLKNVPSCWFTNLNVEKHNEILTLYKNYTPEAYKKYDNYDAIEVSKTSDIPKDWTGEMGVPITFLDKHNPNQFEIVGQSGVDIKLEKGRPYINGKRLYSRIFIKLKK